MSVLQPAKPKVTPFMGKVESTKYSNAVWKSMCREQQMQVRKLQEQQGIKPTYKQPITEAWIAALKNQLEVNSHPEEGDVMKKEGVTPEEPTGERNRGNPVVNDQALGDKCKESSWIKWSLKGDFNEICVKVAVSCANVLSNAVVVTKIELNEMYVVGDLC